MTSFWTALILIFGVAVADAETTPDWVTGFPREVFDQKEWKPGKKVAVCFVLYVEVWGFGKGPNFRDDMASRNPDLVNEAFRNYGINFGIERVGGIFREADAPLSIALSALFPSERPDVWRRFRALMPKSPIIAHGMNNSTQQLPLADGLEAQEKYIRATLDRLEKDTGIRSKGWTSPSVYGNADTFRACAASGISYSLDAMDSDYLSVLKTPEGMLQLIPYPPTTVDMGNFLGRNYTSQVLEDLWTESVAELAREAEKNPNAPATVVAIGIHPFVVGTPDGAAALRRTLQTLKQNKSVWITDTEALLQASAAQPK